MAPALVRHMSDTPETPLSKFMPQIAAIPGQAISAIVGLTGKAIVGVATSGPVKGLVTNFGDRLVVEESIVNIADLDPAYWAYWLSTTGYTNQAGGFHEHAKQDTLGMLMQITCTGFKKLGEAAKAKAAAFNPEQVTSLITGLHS